MAEFYQTTLLVDRESLFHNFYRSSLHLPTGPDGKTPPGRRDPEGGVGKARNQVADVPQEEGGQHQGFRHLPQLLGSTRFPQESRIQGRHHGEKVL